MEDIEAGRLFSGWKASCVAIPLAVRGGSGRADGDHGYQLSMATRGRKSRRQEVPQGKESTV